MDGRYLSDLAPTDVTMVNLLEERAARDGNSIFYTWGDTAETVDPAIIEPNSRRNRFRSRQPVDGPLLGIV